MASIGDIVTYWADLGPQGWYSGDPALDAEIRGRFMTDWQQARAGEREGWIDGPEGALAYLVLTDQFPRNMFRDDPQSFDTDARALAAADRAVAAGWDMGIAEPMRQFFYLPFMHAEDAAAQARCMALIGHRLPLTGASNRLHALAHQNVIAQFGRFPWRNAALGRADTAAEAAFLAAGAYGAVVRALQTGGDLPWHGAPQSPR